MYFNTQKTFLYSISWTQHFSDLLKFFTFNNHYLFVLSIKTFPWRLIKDNNV